MIHELVEELTLLQERWSLSNEWMDRVCHSSFSGLKKADIQDLDLRGPMAFASIGRKLSRWLGGPEQELEWLTKASDSFGGLPPIEVCASSLENVQWVAYTLDTHLIAAAKQIEKNEKNLEI